MSRVAPEDKQFITHVEFICDEIHDYSDKLYEDLLERDYEKVKTDSKELIKKLADLIQSMSDEI